jgi:ATP-dependent DNA helicase PIF1
MDFPEKFRWDKSGKKWVLRKNGSATIGRLVSLHPAKGDVYYLRMLLCHDHCIGKTSYADMMTVNGEKSETYQAVCAQLGLLADDSEWDAALADAALTHMPTQIRELFVAILLFCSPSDAPLLFTTHVHEMWDDYEEKMRLASGDAPRNVRLLQAMVQLDIESRLELEGKQMSAFGLPSVSDELRAQVNQAVADARLDALPREIRFQVEHDRVELQKMVDHRLDGVGVGQQGMYRPAQRQFHDLILQAVADETQTERCFFLDARGGTGKTYVENGILAAVRLIDQDSVALAVAVSGIAATLLMKASTFHSRTKAPIVGLDSTTVFNIRRGSKEAKLFEMCKVVVWDEAPMGHRHLLEAFDRTLQDICGDSESFFLSQRAGIDY